MKRYFVPVELKNFNDRRFYYYLPEPGDFPKARDRIDVVYLWNKNGNRMSVLKIVRPSLTRYGWIVETENLDRYWERSILEDSND